MEPLRLEYLCLSHIINNFSTFNYAYSLSENFSLQRNLQFLQRAYSAHLIKKLEERGKLKAEYLKFVINRYVKELDFKIFDASCWENVIERVIEIAESLVKVTFENEIFGEYPEKMKEIIALLQNVEYLCVPHDCDDETVKLISKSCPNLKELDLRDTINISDEAVKSLCGDGFESLGIRSLRILRLDSADISNETIAFILKNMPSLEIFIHCHLTKVLYSLHEKDLIEGKLHTNKKYSLTELYFGNDYATNLVEVLNICTVLCPNVKKLSCPVALQEHVNWCSKFTKLEDLTLHNYNGEIQLNLDEILKLKGSTLVALNIEGFSLSMTVLFQNCRRLEKLRVKNIDFHCTKNASIPTLRLLREFVIDTEALPISVVAEPLSLILKFCPRIENLSILHSELTDIQINDMLVKYCERNTIKSLNFSFSEVNANFLLLIIISCTSLKRLNIEFCKEIHIEDINLLTQTANSTKNVPEIIWNDDELSDFSLYSDYDDFINEYDAYDGYDTDDSYGEFYDDSYELSE